MRALGIYTVDDDGILPKEVKKTMEKTNIIRDWVGKFPYVEGYDDEVKSPHNEALRKAYNKLWEAVEEYNKAVWYLCECGGGYYVYDGEPGWTSLACDSCESTKERVARNYLWMDY